MFKKVFVATVFVIPSLAFAAFDKCLDSFPNQKPPMAKEQGRDLCFDGFAVYYSPTKKKPIYTVEKISRASLAAEPQERTNQFYEEARLPDSERAKLDDYKGSGYDRGHNSEAATKRTPEAMAQSFSLANMMPQAPQNNRGVWAKDVEKASRKYAQRANGDVYLFTGSVGQSGTIGRGHVVVPQFLFKLVYDKSANRAWAYWLPNTDDAKMSSEAIISYSELVSRTGIDFGLGNPSK